MKKPPENDTTENETTESETTEDKAPEKGAQETGLPDGEATGDEAGRRDRQENESRSAGGAENGGAAECGDDANGSSGADERGDDDDGGEEENGPAPSKKKKSHGAVIYGVIIPAAIILVCLLIALFGGKYLKSKGFSVVDLPGLFRKDALFSGDPAFVKDAFGVYFLDIGQGDAALVRTPGGEYALIDAGPDVRAGKLVNLLKRIGVKKLDYLILTHPHEDHIGGADEVFAAFEVETVITPDVGAHTAAWLAVVNAIDRENCRELIARPGDKYKLTEDCTFTILAPYDTDVELNNCSIVLRFDYGARSFLFTGDAQSDEEKDLLSRPDVLPYLDCDVLKVGHHGSRTSSGEDFLAAVTPVCSVISCAKNNDYGHPHLAALRRLNACGTAIARTDKNGTVLIQSDGSDLWILCEKGEAPRTSPPAGANVIAAHSAVFQPIVLSAVRRSAAVFSTERNAFLSLAVSFFESANVSTAAVPPFICVSLCRLRQAKQTMICFFPICESESDFPD